MPILRVENLSFTYNRNSVFFRDAIKDISFCAEKGEIIGIIGHTGSGKSTLVQHLNGLLKADSGTVYFKDKDIWEQPKKIKEVRSSIGLVFQYPEYQLFDETVYKDIAFGPINMGVTGEELQKRVYEAAESVGLSIDYMEKSPFELSGGEKRRVAIAGVIAMQPEIVVFDEPTAGLDPKGRETIIEIIKNYREKHNATILIVSHSMEDMALLADKLLVLSSGEVKMFDTPKAVFAQKDKLEEIGLSVPLVTQVIHGLAEKGIDLPEDIITLDEAVEALLSLKGGNKRD